MEKVNRNSKLRIIFSSVALSAFVLFNLCDNLLVREFTTYHTYGWRLNVLNDLFLAIPFVALFVFSIMERKMKYINGRVYVAGIFALYLMQVMLLWLSDGTSEFSIFCCGFLGRTSEIVTAILIVRIVMLILIPIAHKNMLRFYSLGMIALLLFDLVAILTSDYFYMRNSVAETVIAMSIDILFHVALFFFSDLLDKENESMSWLAFLSTLMYPIFGDILDDYDYDLEDSDSEKIKSPDSSIKTDYVTEYKKILLWFMNEEDTSFLPVNSFLHNLAQEIVSEDKVQYYSIEEYDKNLNLLADKVKEINSIRPGFIDEGFIDLIDLLLSEKTEESFRMDVITVAKLMLNERMATWMGAVKQYTEYNCNPRKETP